MQTSFPWMNLSCAPATEVSLRSAIELPRAEAEERKLDQILADSFPASDPPSWTGSVVRPAPAVRTHARTRAIGPIGRALRRAAALF